MTVACFRPAVLLAVSLAAISCSKGPARPQPGTPAFYWSAAQEAYRAGDFVKTAEQLGYIIGSESEYAARARIQNIVVASGLTQGYMELADAYENGARMNRTNPMAFRKQAAILRAAAAQSSLQYTEALHKYMDTAKEPVVALAFAMPAGAANEPATLGKLAKGILPLGAEAEGLQQAMLQRGVVVSACRSVGEKSDTAKAAEVYQAGQTARERFFLAMAKTLYAQSELFGPKKLDQPRRAKVLCTEALEALGLVPPSKETKQLEKDIQSAMKKMKIAS